MKIRDSGQDQIEVEVISGVWITYERGMKAILGEVKRLNGINSKGYCKRAQALMGISAPVFSSRKHGLLHPGHLLSIHKLSGLPIAYMFDLNLQEKIEQVVTRKYRQMTCSGSRVQVDDAIFDFDNKVDRLIAVLGYLTGSEKHVKAVLSHSSIVSICRKQNRVSDAIMVNAHMYTGLPIDLLEDIVQ